MGEKKEFVHALKHGRVPNIGDIFVIKHELVKFASASSFRATGWLKVVPLEDRLTKTFPNDILMKQAAKEAVDHTGNESSLLVWCAKDEAMFVTGTGVCGCIVPIETVQIVGQVSWPLDHIAEEHNSHCLRIGEVLF